MKNISIFCGSSPGTNDVYMKTAFEVGVFLAKQDITIIYGGASVGIMGAVADGALQFGGKVIGVLPRFLNAKEIAHENLTKLILVDSMHERKTKMNDLCDAVIALPGGFGTMEEVFEMLTWAQLGLHKKPIGLLNVDGFYDPLLHQADVMVQQGFLKSLNRDMVLTGRSIEELFILMANYIAPEVPKWIRNDEV